MKKIMFLLLMILTLSLAACSNEYERLYNLDNDIKLVEIFSEEQAKEYLEEVKKVLEKIDYITYEGEQYCTDISFIVKQNIKLLRNFKEKEILDLYFRCQGLERTMEMLKKQNMSITEKMGIYITITVNINLIFVINIMMQPQ